MSARAILLDRSSTLGVLAVPLPTEVEGEHRVVEPIAASSPTTIPLGALERRRRCETKYHWTSCCRRSSVPVFIPQWRIFMHPRSRDGMQIWKHLALARRAQARALAHLSEVGEAIEVATRHGWRTMCHRSTRSDATLPRRTEYSCTSPESVNDPAARRYHAHTGTCPMVRLTSKSIWQQPQRSQYAPVRLSFKVSPVLCVTGQFATKPHTSRSATSISKHETGSKQKHTDRHRRH